jgi:uncharacterized protein
LPTEITLIERVREVPRDEWDALVGDDDSPFVEWTWLDCLEEAGCVRPEQGWLPRHMTIRKDGRLVAALPVYVKGHSEGEFVFDWGWAGLADRLGIPYYPKVIVAVPFTPATGARALVLPGEDRREMVRIFAAALKAWAEEVEASSVHVLFPTEEEAALWTEHGMMLRLGIQYHFHRRGGASFEDYLSRFNSKKRNQIKREVAQPAKDGVIIETLAPDQLTPDVVRAMHALYLDTVDKHVYGRRYLNARFFELVAERFRHRLAWVVARQGAASAASASAGAGGRIVAGAFNVEKGKRLYGRYWGAKLDLPFLHFNVCYYHSIARVMASGGLEVFEPGAGGEHKRARGFEPTLTYSAHWVENPRLRRILADHLAREREHVRGVLTEP